MVEESAGEPDFVCDCEERMRSACKGLTFYKEHESRRYCVLHYPGKEKSADFKTALDSKLSKKDFDFQGVWFPDESRFAISEFASKVDFSSVVFAEAADFSSVDFAAEVSFYSTTFSKEAWFTSARFGGKADFDYASFGGQAWLSSTEFEQEVRLSSATFDDSACFLSANFKGDAQFDSATFSAEANFGYATFRSQADFSDSTFVSEAIFTGSTFNGKTSFSYAALKDFVMFGGPGEGFGTGASLFFQFARIEIPEHVYFHSVTLRPHWFVNADPRKFVFIAVDWSSSVDHEIEGLRQQEFSSPHRLLSTACHQLAINAEENHRYNEASKLRYMSMDSIRREVLKGFVPWKLDWWYWATSGYGERTLRAFALLAGLWVGFALLYTCVGFEPPPPGDGTVAVIDVGVPLTLKHALPYSLNVMRLQTPEPRPRTPTAQTLAIGEAILGPLQAALLVDAIRRRFIR